MPLVLEKRTVNPPAERVLPAASRAVKVTVVEVPDAIESDDTATDDLATDTFPGVTVIVGLGVFVTAALSMVAFIVVALPAISPVKVAVYVPLL